VVQPLLTVQSGGSDADPANVVEVVQALLAVQNVISDTGPAKRPETV
jgi:hypothetical protein